MRNLNEAKWYPAGLDEFGKKEIDDFILSKKRYLFLDIDGVLTSSDHCLLLGYAPSVRLYLGENKKQELTVAEFSPIAVKLIQKLQVNCNADIILHSTWRTDFSLGELNAVFPFTIHATTDGGSRNERIADYILENKLNIEDVAVIDDYPCAASYDVVNLQPRWEKVDCHLGFTGYNYISILEKFGIKRIDLPTIIF